MVSLVLLSQPQPSCGAIISIRLLVQMLCSSVFQFSSLAGSASPLRGVYTSGEHMVGLAGVTALIWAVKGA